MRRTKSVASCYPSLVEVLGRGRRQRNATSLSQPLRRKPLHRHSDDLIRARRRPKNPRPLPMIPPFVILRCVLPYPFVHSDKRLRSLWKKDACGDNTPNHKNSIRPLGSDYTRCYAENASPTTPFCRRKMKKPPLSRRPTMEKPVSPHCVESKLLSFASTQADRRFTAYRTNTPREADASRKAVVRLLQRTNLLQGQSGSLCDFG